MQDVIVTIECDHVKAKCLLCGDAFVAAPDNRRMLFARTAEHMFDQHSLLEPELMRLIDSAA
jgi:hypothetical protein